MSQGHGALMDGVYRWQRHIYDISRKYYLLGRDRLITDLAPPPGGTVLEVGCGTGRNLIAAAKAWPDARLHGVDISRAMLDTAGANIRRAGLVDRITLAQGDACAFDARALFGRAAFDRVFISYALSMIPDWEGALAQAARCVAPGGRLEIVDFGQQERLPVLWKRGLFAWLGAFHVTPRAALPASLDRIAGSSGARMDSQALYRGYAVRARLVMP